MFIQTEATPNPATIKFIPGVSVYPPGSADFRKPEETDTAPLAQRLFRIQGVSGVFYGRDFVSVTKAEDSDWVLIKPMVLAALMEHFSTGQPVMLESQQQAVSETDNELVVQIRELLDTRVRPMVAMDGGDIVFDRFEDGIVYLHIRGACAGCPSSTATLKAGIENMLRHFVPEVVEVRPVAA